MYPLQLIITIVIVIGIGFWSFSPKDVSFFGNPTVNVKPSAEVDLDLDLDLERHDVASGLNSSSRDDNEAEPIMILLGFVIATLVGMLPFPRWYGE